MIAGGNLGIRMTSGTAKAGGALRLECGGGFSPALVSWTRDSLPLPDIPERYVKPLIFLFFWH